uniref:FGENESH: predicted gene_10.69 protein n=1 Tax=Rhodotorula toruloides TaxID=5286 RepID=A0A0K3CQB1_RHOTO
MPPSDSEGSVYQPEDSPPAALSSHAAARAQPGRIARDSSAVLDFSPSLASSAVPTGMNTSAVGTPMGSEVGDDAYGEGEDSTAQATTTEATPDPQPQPAKKSRALNFLKKKEPKTSINIKGTVYQIRDDEIVLPDDPRGEMKIDSYGNLLGGRRWKVHTFTSPLRPNQNKVYILSIDAARAAGFRDSLYFFRRNPTIHKLTCNQQEKDRLIEIGRLSGNLKSRAVTMVAARNVFKVMGATFVQDGKYVVDDYYEDKAIAAGHKPGEPAFLEAYDPDKDTGTLATSKGNAPPGATTLGLNHLIGHPGKPKLPGADLIASQLGGGPLRLSEDRNWMHEYAKNVRDENAKLVAVRRGNVGQVQVGLNVEEREEDCWEWIEEEYTDDEEEPTPSVKMEDSNAASPAPEPTPPPPRPKKRRMIRVYNPIRGVYEPETNVPHVYRSTQPREVVEWERASKIPRISGDEADGEAEAATEKAREAAAKFGLASIEYLSDERVWAMENGGSTVDDALAARKGREDLLPGMWDFLEIARQEGIAV